MLIFTCRYKDAKLGKGQQAGSPLNNSLNRSWLWKVREKDSNHNIELHVILPPLFSVRTFKKSNLQGQICAHLHQGTDNKYPLLPSVTLQAGAFYKVMVKHRRFGAQGQFSCLLKSRATDFAKFHSTSCEHIFPWAVCTSAFRPGLRRLSRYSNGSHHNHISLSHTISSTFDFRPSWKY